MSITDELIEALQQVVDSASPSKRDNPAMFSAWEHARETLAKARALQQAPPTTVIGWLELARDAGLPWANKAIQGCNRSNGAFRSATLNSAIYGFGNWSKTKEGHDFWSEIRERNENVSFAELIELREMARARKEGK